VDVEKFLRDYPMLGKEILRLNRELNEMIACRDENYCTLQAQKLNDMPKAAYPEENLSSVESAVIKLESLTERYDSKINYYTNRLNDIIDQKETFDAIWSDKELLTAIERKVIENRCFLEYDWATVARLSNYSRISVIRTFDKAVQKVSKKINDLAS